MSSSYWERWKKRLCCINMTCNKTEWKVVKDLSLSAFRIVGGRSCFLRNKAFRGKFWKCFCISHQPQKFIEKHNILQKYLMCLCWLVWKSCIYDDLMLLLESSEVRKTNIFWLLCSYLKSAKRKGWNSCWSQRGLPELWWSILERCWLLLWQVNPFLWPNFLAAKLSINFSPAHRKISMLRHFKEVSWWYLREESRPWPLLQVESSEGSWRSSGPRCCYLHLTNSVQLLHRSQLVCAEVFIVYVWAITIDEL